MSNRPLATPARWPPQAAGLHRLHSSAKVDLRGLRFELLRFALRADAHRQKNAEARNASALCPVAPAGERTLVFLDNPLADPEAETRALGRLGAEEGLEQSLGILGTNADSCINNRDRRPAALSHPIAGFAHVYAQS